MVQHRKHLCLLFKRNKLLMFPWEPARQSSLLDSPVIKIKCERVNGYVASCGRVECYLDIFRIQNTYPYVKKEINSSAFSDNLGGSLFFWITFASSAVSSYTELGGWL